VQREPKVLFRRSGQSSLTSAHVGCLSRINGLVRPLRFPGEPSADVLISAQFQPEDVSAIEAQLFALPPGPLEGGGPAQICHFEWPPRPRAPPVPNPRHEDIGGNLDDLQRRLLSTSRDFSSEDYEMLLELDERERTRSSHGNELAATILLSQMPVSRVPATGSSAGEQCSICLEKMKENEEIRTLPCMHFFHRECIDKWISMAGAAPKCPIDQAPIQFPGASQ
jgi:hypothetical protein